MREYLKHLLLLVLLAGLASYAYTQEDEPEEREYYNKEDLLNKKIIVVTNLMISKLRGVESNGMLLAAEKGEEPVVVFVDKSKPGDKVLPDGYGTTEQVITFDQFKKLNKLSIKDQKLVYDNMILKTDKEDISVDMPDGSKVR